jgi:hypothetical protein
MFCDQCGRQIPEKNAFCSYCGSTAPQLSPSIPPPPGYGQAYPAGPYLPRSPFTARMWKMALIAGLITLVVVGGISALIIVLWPNGGSAYGQMGMDGTVTTQDGNQGGTMSEADYANLVTPILEGSYQELESNDLSNINFTGIDEQNVQEFDNLESDMLILSSDLLSDFSRLQNMQPPAAAYDIHSQILDLYKDIVAVVDEIRAGAAYLAAMGEASLQMQKVMTDVQARFDSVSTYDQLIPLIDDSYNAWNNLLGALDNLAPPPSLASFHQLMVKAARDLTNIYTQLRTAAVNQDQAAANDIAAQADQVGNDFDANVRGSLREFSNMVEQYSALTAQLYDLIGQVAGLK